MSAWVGFNTTNSDAADDAMMSDLVESIQKNEPIYELGESTVPIPSSAIKGRVGTKGKTFCGVLDTETGKVRIDCAEELPFWLELDLSEVSCFKYAPGSSETEKAAKRFASEAAVGLRD